MRREYRLGELTVGALLAEGGSADLYDCRVPDENRRLLYKAYKQSILPLVDVGVLRELVYFPARLDAEQWNRLDSITAWPRAAVVDNGALAGILMDRAPDRFMRTDRKGAVVPRDLREAGAGYQTAVRRQSDYYEPPHKAALLGRLLEALSMMNGLGLVFGDLQPKNVLITAPSAAPPAILLVDCDSFWISGRHILPAFEPFGFDVPQDIRAGSDFNHRTDLYKFAIASSEIVGENLGKGADPQVLSAISPPWVVGLFHGVIAANTADPTPAQLRQISWGWGNCVSRSGQLRSWQGQHLPYVMPDRSTAQKDDEKKVAEEEVDQKEMIVEKKKRGAGVPVAARAFLAAVSVALWIVAAVCLFSFIQHFDNPANSFGRVWAIFPAIASGGIAGVVWGLVKRDE